MNKKNSQLKDSEFNQKFQDLKGLKSTDLVEGLKIQKPDSKQLKRGLKKAISRNNWLNYLVLFISIYFFWNTGVAIRHNHKLGAKFDALKLKTELLQESNKNLELQKRYYSSPEYQEKALKENFNLVAEGENVLIVKDLPEPKNKRGNVFSELQELRQLINR